MLHSYVSLVKRIVACLNKINADYMLTGALAVDYYGVPRTSMDIDVVIRLTEDNIPSFSNSLEKKRLKVDILKFQKAIEKDQTLVTVEDEYSPYTVDFFVTTKKFRKKLGKIFDLKTWFPPVDDLVLWKLRMIKSSMSLEDISKDKRDIKSIISIQRINLKTIKKKSGIDGTLNILNSILEDMEK